MSCAQDTDDPIKLLESASLTPHAWENPDARCTPCLVRRGMPVQTSEGCIEGHVAAVILDAARQEITHVLLVQERLRLEYRLLPVALIQQVDEGQLLLHTFEPGLESLPVWSGCDSRR